MIIITGREEVDFLAKRDGFRVFVGIMMWFAAPSSASGGAPQYRAALWSVPWHMRWQVPCPNPLLDLLRIRVRARGLIEPVWCTRGGQDWTPFTKSAEDPALGHR